MTQTTPAADATFREFHRMDMRLTYADCDPAKIIYFAAWFPWMERVHSEWMYLNGMRQDTMEERHGFATITRAAECEYLAPASLFQRIRISMGIGHIGRSSFRVEARMLRLDDDVVVAQGSITVVTLDTTNTVIPIPDPLRRLLQDGGATPDQA